MHRLFLLLFLCFGWGLLTANQQDTRSHAVVVSIAPYKFFVEAVAGDTVDISLLVPPGASFHDYEPTPKQVLTAATSDIWFRIGESFETRAQAALQYYNPRIQVVDLRDGVDLIVVGSPGHVNCSCHQGGADLHIWLSVKEVKVQAKHIAEALSSMYPEHKTKYDKNLASLLKSLTDLDQEIRQTLQSVKNRTIMVAHPAYAYFTRDYNLTQLPIEYEGKDPTPRQLHNILLEARAAHINTVFVQQQYATKGATLIANELGAKLVMLDPYSGDYFATLRNIAKRIAEQDTVTPNP